MKDIIKDYGPAIGPLLAFLLGVFTLYLKIYFDRIQTVTTLKKSFNMLVKLVEITTPPRHFYPNKSTDGGFHADEARNLSNLARFYNKLLALRSLFTSIDKDINKSDNPKFVQQFYSMKWWFDLLIKEVEQVRDKNSEYNKQAYNSIEDMFNKLYEASKGNDYLSKYIEPE